MLAQVDPQTFIFNLTLILGGVFLLVFLFIGGMATVTLVRAWFWARARRKAEEKWLKYARRSDGRAYPPTVVATCDLCRRGGSHIYAEYGLLICPVCYDQNWQEIANWTPDQREAARAAGKARVPPAAATDEAEHLTSDTSGPS